MLKIKTEDRRFVDAAGRQRIFNGVNLCDKGNNENGEKKRQYAVPLDEW